MQLHNRLHERFVCVYGVVYRPVLGFERREVPHHVWILPAILDIQRAMVSSAVGRGRVYAAIAL